MNLPEPRGIVKTFARHMEKALRKNDWKGRWGDCDWPFLMDKLQEEVDELIKAITTGKQHHKIAREAADVANIAMMIADNSAIDFTRGAKKGEVNHEGG